MDNKSYSKGICWIDDCRIPFTDGGWGNRTQETKDMFGSKGFDTNPNTQQNDSGRFPANILVSDDMLNDGVLNGGGSYSGIKERKRNRHFKERGQNYGKAESPDNYGDKGTNSRYYDIDKWFDKIIDG